METLHLSLKSLNEQQIELRYWRDQQSAYEDKILAIAEISDLLEQSELDYYVLRPNLVDVGQRLFNWIDGEGRWLSRAIQDCASEGIVLAIAPDAKIAHLPWEILHDDTDFLVNKFYPMIVPIRWLDQRSEERVVQDRPLQVLFMATSPEQVQPVLQFEQEEATLLKITENLPLTLRVEESGCVEELNKLWRRYPQDTFDVFHLTGHADHKPESPYTPFFITESLIGERQDTSAEDLLRVFQQRRPRLMFLSGCRTGQASQEGTVPSLAETLVDKGMPAVMGWGRPVLDTTATQAAAKLYESLAAGDPLAQALSITYRELIQNQVKGWHLLRLYVRGESWGPVVEPPGDYVPPPEQIREQFLDHQDLVRVATPDQFVGRRRILQQCLRALRERNTLGVMLHGMGGVGKSTVAARLLERLPDYQPIVIFQGLDAAKLERLLRLQCLSPKGQEILEIPEDRLPFMQRLTAFLDQGLNTPEQRFLFVLDDFEANLELRGGQQVLKTEMVEVLNALLQALSRSKSPHRLLITSRYDIQFPQLNERLTRVSLAALRGADLQKKCDRLTSFQGASEVEPSLKEKALALADGNPRLMEWLDKVLQVSGVEPESILNSMEGKASEFRENILAEKLLEQQSEEIQQMLARMQVFELPVPYSALLSICNDLDDLVQCCQRATALGLLESNATSSVTLYRLPRILLPLLSPVETEDLYQSGFKELYQLWWTEKDCNEEQAIELFRLATCAKDDERSDKIGSSLGERWRDQGRYRDAGLMWEQIVASRQNLLGSGRLSFATSLNTLALIYVQQGRYSDAEHLYNQALTVFTNNGGRKQPDVASVINNLATLYYYLGEYEDAKNLYIEAIEIFETLLELACQCSKTLTNAHSEGHRNFLVVRYTATGLELDEESIISTPENFDLDMGIKLASSLNGLGLVNKYQQHPEDARSLFIQAIKILRKLIGKENLYIATSLNNLLCIYYEQKLFKKAEYLGRNALKIRKKLLVSEHPDIAESLDNLASVYREQERYLNAEQLYKQSLEMRKKTFGTDHYLVGISLNNLANLYYYQKRYEEATDLSHQALQICENCLGKEHPTTKKIRGNIESRL